MGSPSTLINVDSTIHDGSMNQSKHGRARAPAPPSPAPEPADHLSGREAAALLGVKRETLYAYASRGLLRSAPGPGGGRARLYLREDLERLRARSDARAGHGPVAAGALRWGEPVLSSAITKIDPKGLFYRGRSAVALAEHATFEAAAELLWTGALPADAPSFRWPPPGRIGVPLRPFAALLPEAAPPAIVLPFAVSALAAVDPDRFPAGDAVEHARARALIARLAALLAAPRGARAVGAALRAGSVAASLIVALDPRERRAPSARSIALMDRALVLSADHELNASAFTARVAASADADLYACMLAGLAAFSGPKHGVSPDRVEALVHEVGRPERAPEVIHTRVKRGETIPGFGHPLYPGGDPRAPPLLAASLAHAPESRPLRALAAMVEVMQRAGLPAPSLDVGLVAVSLALGLPLGSAPAIFGVGRSAGWVAHALEQRAQGFLLRPRAAFVGEEP